jgi:alpha-ribazole phosphatase
VPTTDLELWCWRHPKAIQAQGRCIGHTNLAVDPRKSKRLAHRIRAVAQRQRLPHTVWVSTLLRSADVGRWLKRWGWQVRADARLCEMDFGAWDGLPWQHIAWGEVEAWQHDLLHHAPGGGESLLAVSARVQGFCSELGEGAHLLVSHGGWINTLLHVRPGQTQLLAQDWPAAPPHGSLRRVKLESSP